MARLGDIIGRGLLSARPAAGVEGRLYDATDTDVIYRDNGSSWDYFMRIHIGDNYDPLIYPASPDALDDEFEGVGSIDVKWTKTNDPAGGDAMSQSQHKGYLLVGLPELVTDDFDNLVRLSQSPAASGTMTYVARVSVVAEGLGGDDGEFAGAGIYVGNTTDDEFVAAGVELNNVHSVNLASRVAGLKDNGSGVFTDMASISYQALTPGTMVWLKLDKTTAGVWTAANTYDVYYSMDGILWQQIATESYSFTTAADEVGLYFRAPKAQSGTPKAYALADFFRKTA